MKFQTLTSTFVLSLLLTGPEVVAMDMNQSEKDETRIPTIQKSVDQTEGEKPEGITPHPSLVEDVEEPFNIEDLTRSALNLDVGVLKALVAANKANPTLEEQSAGKQAVVQIMQDIAEKKKQKNQIPSLTQLSESRSLDKAEEQAVFSLWNLGNYLFGKKTVSEEMKITPIVISTPVEKISEEVQTQALTSTLKTPITVEEPSYSWLANLNPLNLVPSNWWGTTNSVVTPSDDEVIKVSVNLESQQEPSPSQTNNLTPDDKRDGE
jgi:hypothetical protein